MLSYTTGTPMTADLIYATCLKLKKKNTICHR